MSRADNCQTLMKFAHKQSQTRFPSYQCMYQVWLKSLDIYSSYCPENENMCVSQADNSIKIWWNLPISNPKPDLHTINAHTKFGENPLMFLLKLSSGNENMGVSRADNSIKVWHNLTISNPKPDLHNINAYTMFGENPLMFTQVITWKRKLDGQMDGHMNIQRETIISRHYRVALYKNTDNKKACKITQHAKSQVLCLTKTILMLILCPFQHYLSHIDMMGDNERLCGKKHWTVTSWIPPPVRSEPEILWC